MKLQRIVIAALACAILATSSICLANNNLFLPGDAFFPAVLTKADVEALQITPAGQRTFTYNSFGGYEGAFCGYAGYNRAAIPALDDAFAKNLAEVYAKIRAYEERQLLERTINGKSELIETNPMRVLFYPPKFVFPRYTLGLRYNENWVAEVLKFGHRREDGYLRLCCLIPDPHAVECSWRDAEIVPPLKATLPEVKLVPVPPIEEPIVVPGPVKAIVIGSQSLVDLFRIEQDDILSIYVVDSKGITELVYDEGEWNSAESE